MVQKEKALLILKEGDEAREWTLGPRTTLGRDVSSDVHLPDRRVSRLHASVEYTDEGFVLRDHESKNGTWLNGAPVDGPRLLHDGDEVSVASRYKLYFVDAEATAPLLFEGHGLRIDPETVTVYVGGAALDPPLSGPQFELLRALYEAGGAVVPREEIVGRVYPNAHPGGVSEDAVDALVRRLRHRLAEADPDHAYVVTVRGYGFRLERG